MKAYHREGYVTNGICLVLGHKGNTAMQDILMVNPVRVRGGFAKCELRICERCQTPYFGVAEEMPSCPQDLKLIDVNGTPIGTVRLVPESHLDVDSL